MKPTVIPTAMDTNSAGPANGINIPINHEYGNAGVASSNSPQYQHQHHQHQPMPQQHPQSHYHNPSYPDEGFGSPKTNTRQYPQHAPNQQQQQQIPAHFQQGFGFEPDMDIDMDMFPRSRLGRAHHDPFAGFGSSHFGFPSFATLGRRRAAGGGADPLADDDFFHRLPSEFRQYIPEGFGQRRTGSGGSMPHQQPSYAHTQTPAQPEPYYQQSYAPAAASTPPIVPQSPTKHLCDAAIQTDEPAVGHTVTDGNSLHTGNADLNQHGFRNTVDMGVKSSAEADMSSARAQSAPPTEQQQQQQPVNGKRPTPPPATYQNQPQQSGTQTSPHVQGNFAGQYQQSPMQQQPPISQPQTQPHRTYYAPQQQAHPQQKQQTPPPPQTPGGTYIRTIPIFVEGRTEPIINSHKEIPNQNAPPGSGATATASASARAYGPNSGQGQGQGQQPQYQQQQQQRPPPLNTQQNPEQQQDQNTGLPPQTPHTVDSINKIQDIQRDVLDLMGKVEKFTGTRKDKEYVYLDEMLTRNLLKLDTIDTNGKESIRLARKEAIKCIQASINVLEAKAEENASNKTAGGIDYNAEKDNGGNDVTQAKLSDALTATAAAVDQQPSSEESLGSTTEASKSQEAIPLPPPPSVAAAADAESLVESAKQMPPQKSASGTQTSGSEAGAIVATETAPNDA